MAMFTETAFNYGHTVDETNQNINFNDGSITNLAVIAIGSYTLREFADAVANALTGASEIQEYTVTVDRTDNANKLIISAAGAFDLLIDTGDQKAITAFTLMGFNDADLTGLASYEGDSLSGSQYVPQFLLDKYVEFQDIQKRIQPTVNESASGVVEAISFGTKLLMECNITLITDIINQGVITNNPTGVSDARNFLIYITTKAPIEFIKDTNAPTDIVDCFLESTTEDKNGTSFRLKELYARKLIGYFETGKLVFRKL